MTEREQPDSIGHLFTEKYSCAICNGKRIFREGGVKDLYRLLQEESDFLDVAFVANKVAGKAAAAPMIPGGVKKVFAGITCHPATGLLRKASVETGYRQEVPHTVNHSHTNMCPPESRFEGLQTPEKCLVQIKEFLTAINSKTNE